VAESPSWESISATSAEFTWPSLSRSMTLNDSRMLCSRGGGSFDRASLVTARVKGAGRMAGLSTGFSNGVYFSTGVNFSVGTSFSIDIDLSTTGGGVLSRPPSNRAASDAVLKGRTVACVDEETLRVGDGMFRAGDSGASVVLVVPRVFSHEGGFCEALLVVDCRSVACDGVVGVSFGFSGELLGVEGRTVDGEFSRMDPGLRKGDWRGLLKESGEGL
jgi:hypothetical protein